MSWVDIVIIGLIAVSSLISVFRGFVKEALSLTTWALAFVLAMTYAQTLAQHLPPSLSDPMLRAAVGFAVIFIGILVLGGVLGILAGMLVQKTGLSGTDRSLGVVFGFVRGVLVVGVVVLLAGVTSLPQEPWWQESFLMDHFVRLALWMRGFLPEDLQSGFSFP